MAKNCKRCGKEIGNFSTVAVVLENNAYCFECSEKEKIDMADKIYTPDEMAVKRALSALLTQDPDTKKLFEEGSRTYLKIFGGDINNYINLNANLIQACILFRILEKLESIDQRLAERDL